MMSVSCGTEITLTHAEVGEKIVGRQRNADRRTDSFSAIYIYDDDDVTLAINIIDKHGLSNENYCQIMMYVFAIHFTVKDV